jgi:hypothetical protein
MQSARMNARTMSLALSILMRLSLGMASTLLFGTGPAVAHHSYAMFDMSAAIIVEGTVAKHEWVNPHTFVWLYVEKTGQPGLYDLYAFENGPIGLMMRYGWTKDSLKAGDKLTVHYFPLKDGRTGGSFIKAVDADGKEHIGDPHAPGVARELGKAAGESPPP